MTTKREFNGHVLLTAADRQIESLLRGNDPATAFDDNLIQAILFYDGAVLPDIFAFISSVVSERQAKPGLSLLELAIRHGLVIPAFRSSCGTFAESLDVIKRQRIQGLQKNAAATAHRLDKSLEKSPQHDSVRFFNWPEDISLNYARHISTALTRFRSDAPSFLPALQEQYLSMKNLATEPELLALHEELLVPKRELRRGTFLNVLLKVLNKRYDSGNSEVDDCNAHLLIHPACERDSSLRSAIEAFVSTANAIYQINMADSFKLGGAYMGNDLYNGPSLIGVNTALSAIHGVDFDGPSDTPKTLREFSRKIQMPKASQLLEVPYADLMAIREDLGIGYFSAVKAWKEDPEGNEDILSSCLNEYAKELTSRVKSKVPFVKVVLRKYGDSDKKSIKWAAKFAYSLFSDDDLGLKEKLPYVKILVSAVGKLSNIGYHWYSTRSVKVNHTVPKVIVV